jgi:osmoprotectant transport system permease protein
MGRLLLIPLAALFLLAPSQEKKISIGSKSFPESRLLGEMFALLLEDRGYVVERKLWLGGTKVCFDALVAGGLDVYPEYTGTIEQAILKLDHRASLEELRGRVRKDHKLEILDPLGFNNTYAIAIRRDTAKRLGLETISDLGEHPELKHGYGHEFLNRKDGWPSLSSAYGFTVTPVGLEHGLAYQAIEKGEIDVIDAYSTDGKLLKYRLKILKDDKEFFPRYFGVPLVRGDMDPEIQRLLNLLAGKIDDERMMAANARVEVDKEEFAVVAQDLLKELGLIHHLKEVKEDMWGNLGRRTVEHLLLTFAALALGIMLAIPLGILIYRVGIVAKPVLYIAGILQTIPSIALLALLLPLLGIGWKPAIAALFLYSLLPILVNTAAALFSIDPVLKKVAVGMGLTPAQQLRHVEIPLALPLILAGIRTAAIINIGTATLAAFIGAGGLGEPIVTGLDLNRTDLILQGAIPASLLAIAVQLAFEGLERILVPRHLLQKTGA